MNAKLWIEEKKKERNAISLRQFLTKRLFDEVLSPVRPLLFCFGELSVLLTVLFIVSASVRVSDDEKEEICYELSLLRVLSLQEMYSTGTESNERERECVFVCGHASSMVYSSP